MTKEQIIQLMHEHLTNYSIMLRESIKVKNYEMALVNLQVCKAYLLNLRYIQEQEELDNASIK